MDELEQSTLAERVRQILEAISLRNIPRVKIKRSPLALLQRSQQILAPVLKLRSPLLLPQLLPPPLPMQSGWLNKPPVLVNQLNLPPTG